MPFWATNIIRITQTDLAMMPTFATKVTDSVCKWVSGSIVLLTSALRKRAVTQKLDLDQMSERSIGILKDTYI